MHSVCIESAEENIIPALVQLLSALFTIEQDFSPDAQKQERGLRLLLKHPDRSVILVARGTDAQPIGMVSGQLVFSTAEGAPSLWVEDLIVAPEHRGRGVGRALLDAVLKWGRAHDATRAQLLVDLDNSSALSFYAHQGWQPTRLNARRRPLQ